MNCLPCSVASMARSPASADLIPASSDFHPASRSGPWQISQNAGHPGVWKLDSVHSGVIPCLSKTVSPRLDDRTGLSRDLEQPGRQPVKQAAARDLGHGYDHQPTLKAKDAPHFL